MRVLFRGIDPDGLDELAVRTVAAARRAGVVARIADAVLRAHPPSVATTVPTAATQFEWWGEETGANLMWRTAIIRQGQETPLHPRSLLRVAFATEAAFTGTDPEAAYRSWIEEKDEAQRTAANIARWLSQGWTDWDVTNSDLHNIATALHALTGPQLDRVLRTLSPTQLERWVAEMDNSINGFSRQEKQDLFAGLAARASGETLDRLSAAVVAVSDQETAADLGSAIAEHAPCQVIVDLVRYAAARDLRSHRYSALVPAIAVGGIEDDGAAAQLARLLATRVDIVELMMVDAELAAAHSPEATTEMIDVLARGSDPTTGATLFVSVVGKVAAPARSELISHRATPKPGQPAVGGRDVQAERAIDTAMTELATGLLAADPGALVQQLATKDDPNGHTTSTFWRVLAERGEGAMIGHILDRLRGGEIVSIEAFCAEQAPVPGYTYPHARNLAFAAGTLVNAFTAQAEEAAGDIDAIARTAGALVTVLGQVSGTGGVADNVVGTGADWVLTGHGDHVKEDIDAALADLIDDIRPQLLPPPLPGDGPPGYGGATRAWLDTYGRLLPYA